MLQWGGRQSSSEYWLKRDETPVVVAMKQSHGHPIHQHHGDREDQPRRRQKGNDNGTWNFESCHLDTADSQPLAQDLVPTSCRNSTISNQPSLHPMALRSSGKSQGYPTHQHQGSSAIQGRRLRDLVFDLVMIHLGVDLIHTGFDMPIYVQCAYGGDYVVNKDTN